MKRKFSFNIAPVKIAPKSEAPTKHTQEPTPSQSQSQSHQRHTSKDSICDNSPYINRRVLEAQTEKELRLACRLILQNFKPSDHGMEDTDPKLDFGGMQRQKEHKSQPTEVRVRMPTGAPPESTSSFLPRKPSTKTRTRTKADLEIKARTHHDLPVRANSSRKRADFAWLDERDDKRDEKLKTYGRSASIDMPRSTTARNDTEEDVTLPVTIASTFAHSKNTSTAPTSASWTSGTSSNRRSRQLDNPAAVADAQAAEWMRQELEKKRQQETSQSPARPPTAANPPTRSASIKKNIREYVFPGTLSRTLSRAQSKDSLRATDNNDSQSAAQGLQRSGSTSGWKSWGLPHRSRSKSNSRPGTSKGQADEPDQPRKSESNAVNLNRELPPLPGLDTWKDPEQPKEEQTSAPKSPISGAHIASLMRPQEQPQEHSLTASREHRRSRSDTLAMQYTSAYPVRKSSRTRHITQASAQPKKTAPDNPSRIDRATPATSNPDHHLELSSSNHNPRHRSGDSFPISNGALSMEAPSFSRKMSLDTPTRSTFSPEVKTSRREEQKSRLKKVFTGWMSKKDKKEDWMHKIDDGGSSESPVVRY